VADQLRGLAGYTAASIQGHRERFFEDTMFGGKAVQVPARLLTLGAGEHQAGHHDLRRDQPCGKV